MNHVAIVYWSGTGNTEKMAQCIAEGVPGCPAAPAALLGPGEFSADNWNEYQAVALRLPGHGRRTSWKRANRCHVSGLEGTLSAKKIALSALTAGASGPVDAGVVPSAAALPSFTTKTA